MLALLLTGAAFAQGTQEPAADWPNWRGPSFDGAAEVGSLPSEWTLEDDVVWKTELAGPSAATPIVWGEHVFLTAFEPESKVLLAVAVDRRTGALLWENECGTGQSTSPRSRGRENTLAACSPVSDGEVVCFLFGSGDLVAFDFDGDELWRRNLVEDYGSFSIGWGYAASPLLFRGRLYVPLLQRGKSYLLALDPKSGETLFEHVRPNDANAESQEAYTTPVPFENTFEGKSRWEILVLGADCLSSHDPETGEEYWRWCGLNPRNAPNFRTVSSPVVGRDGMVFVTSPQHNPMHGLRVRGNQVEKLWELARPTPDATTPLFYQGRLYALDGRNQRMVCVEPETGKVLWTGELGTPTFLRASPTGADGKIYVIDAEGSVVVLAAGDELRVLGRVSFDSYPSRSTIVPVRSASVSDDPNTPALSNRGELLVRTAERLFCIR